MRASITPSRRDLIAGSAAAAFLPAPTATAASAIDPDADLLALRPAWDSTFATFKVVLKELSNAEASGDVGRVEAAHEVEATTGDANLAVGEQIASIPAKTLAGLRFKAKVSADQDHSDDELILSIMEDIGTLAARRI